MRNIYKISLTFLLFIVWFQNINAQSPGFGVNLSGMEFGTTSVPTASELNYYNSKGLKFIRVPFLWERIQPTLGGSLNSTYLGQLDGVVAAAKTNGMSVMIDMHNYCRYPYNGSVIGSGSASIANYQDVWTKIATHYASESAIWGYDIMNEPNTLGGANWQNIAQAAITGIRSVDNNHVIVIEGDNWSHGNTWATYNDGLKNLSDPQNNLVYQAHQYFDSDGSGTYSNTTVSGNGANSNTGVNLITPFVNWLKSNNKKGIVGEYGIPNNNDQTNWNTLLTNFLSYLQTNCVGGTYWAGGPAWGSYVLSCEPNGSTDAPQMAVLSKFTTLGSGCSSTSTVTVSVSLTAPANNSSVTQGNNVTVSANASASGATITKVAFYANGTLIGTSTSSPYSITWTNPAAGSYQITAIATASNGQTTTSSAFTFTVTAPVISVSVTSPANNASIVQGNNATISASASVTGATITKVDFYANGTLIGTSTASPYSINWTNPAVGSYQITAIATTSAGQTATSTAITFTVTAPVISISITNPANNTNIILGANQTLSANASITGATITKVDFYSNGTLIGTSSGSPYTIVWSNPPVGSYQITAIATASNGQTATSAAVTLNVALPVFSTSAAPVIDGTADVLWSNYSSTSSNKVLLGTITNSADLSSTWKATWDANALYVLVNVSDEKLVNDGPNVYDDDGIEIYVDMGNTKTTTYGSNQFQYAFRWNDTKVYENIHSATGGVTFATSSLGITSGCTNLCASTGYIMEVRIPWSTLGSSVPSIGAFEGFDIMVNDDDDGGTRDAKISWNAATDNAWQNPSLFGTIVMEGAPCTLPVATISPSGNVNVCSGSTLVLNANQGTGLTYQWYQNGALINGATNANYTINSAGNFTVGVKNNNCTALSSPTSATLSNPPTATITPTGSTSFCAGGSVVLNANSGTGFTYVWKNNGTAISGATSASYTTSAAGNYTVDVTANGCTATSTAIVVTVNTFPSAAITASGNTTFCSGGSVVLNANTGTGLSYLWKNNGASISGATSASYSANTTGNYTVDVTANGCTATSTGTPVTVNTPPAATITAAGNTTFCSGGSVILNANTGTGLTYVWKNNGAAISGATSASYTATTTGNYTVNVTANGCTTTSAAILVTVNTPPSATITAAGNTTFCTGGSVVLNGNTGTGLTYVWKNSGAAISGVTSASYTANTAGSYTIDVTANGCTTSSAATLVTVNTPPAATITATGNTTFCAGGSVVLNANAGTGLSYVWKNNGTPISGATSASYSANASGNYTIDVTANGCPATSLATIVTVNAFPSATITPSGSSNICTGGTISLNANSGTGFTYVWKNNGTVISGANLSSYTASAAGSYSVDITSNSCTSSSGTASVTVSNSSPATIVISGPTNICSGSSATFSTQISNGGNSPTYQWKLNGNNIGSNSPSFSSTSLVDGSIITCTMTSSLACATGSPVISNQISLTISNPPTTANAGPDQFITTTTASLAANQPISGNGLWSGAGTFNNSSAANTTVSGLKTGANILTWTITSGACDPSAANVTINVGTAPVSNNLAPTNVLPGSTITYTIPGNIGSTYNWTISGNATIESGAGTNSISVLFGNNANTSAIISVTETNPYGNATSSANVSIGNSPVVTSIAGSDSVGYNSTGVVYSVPNNPGSTYAWTVPTGATIVSGNGTNSIVVDFGPSGGTGAVSVVETNSYGSATSTKNIQTGPAPVVSSVTGPSNVTPGQTYAYSVTPDPNPNTTYNWSVPQGATIVSGQGTPNITVSFPPGTSTGNVSVTESNGFGTASSNKTVSSVTAIGISQGADISSSVYPNPFYDHSVIRVNSLDSERIYFSITNINGTMYFESEQNTNENINIGDQLPSGIYILRINYKSMVKVIKLIKIE
jgi:hypothetical protein